MEETSILETFRFDFTYRERDGERLNTLFAKYGYPNLKVDLTDAYDGYWRVYNTRNSNNVWEDYHSGFVTFFKDGKNIKIAFDHKNINNIKDFPDREFRNSVYFEPNCKITEVKVSDTTALEERIKELESEVETYKRREEKIMALLKA